MFHIQSITDGLEMGWQEKKATAFCPCLHWLHSALFPIRLSPAVFPHSHSHSIYLFRAINHTVANAGLFLYNCSEPKLCHSFPSSYWGNFVQTLESNLWKQLGWCKCIYCYSLEKLKFKYLLIEDKFLLIFVVTAGHIWCFCLKMEDKEILLGIF